jgi:Fic family protein
MRHHCWPRCADCRRALSENYLVELQNSVLTSPFDKAVQYRMQQNWLRGPARGAAGVTYLPPPPEIVPELMTELIAFANAAPREMDPVVVQHLKGVEALRGRERNTASSG